MRFATLSLAGCRPEADYGAPGRHPPRAAGSRHPRMPAVHLMQLAGVTAFVGGNHRTHGDVKRDDPFAVGSEAIGADLGHHLCRRQSLNGNLDDAQAMVEPCLQLACDTEVDSSRRTVGGGACEDINEERAIRKRCKDVKIIAHAPADQHVAKRVGNILEDRSTHWLTALMPGSATQQAGDRTGRHRTATLTQRQQTARCQGHSPAPSVAIVPAALPPGRSGQRQRWRADAPTA